MDRRWAWPACGFFYVPVGVLLPVLSRSGDFLHPQNTGGHSSRAASRAHLGACSRGRRAGGLRRRGLARALAGERRLPGRPLSAAVWSLGPAVARSFLLLRRSCIPGFSCEVSPIQAWATTELKMRLRLCSQNRSSLWAVSLLPVTNPGF